MGGRALHRGGSETFALCRRKDWVKPLLAAAGIAVPRDSGFPCIVKPADEGGSYGIRTGSICENAAEVERAQLHAELQQQKGALLAGGRWIAYASTDGWIDTKNTPY